MKKFYSTICLALLITFAVPRQAEASVLASLALFFGGYASEKLLDHLLCFSSSCQEKQTKLKREQEMRTKLFTIIALLISAPQLGLAYESPSGISGWLSHFDPIAGLLSDEPEAKTVSTASWYEVSYNFQAANKQTTNSIKARKIYKQSIAETDYNGLKDLKLSNCLDSYSDLEPISFHTYSFAEKINVWLGNKDNGESGELFILHENGNPPELSKQESTLYEYFDLKNRDFETSKLASYLDNAIDNYGQKDLKSLENLVIYVKLAAKFLVDKFANLTQHFSIQYPIYQIQLRNIKSSNFYIDGGKLTNVSCQENIEKQALQYMDINFKQIQNKVIIKNIIKTGPGIIQDWLINSVPTSMKPYISKITNEIGWFTTVVVKWFCDTFNINYDPEHSNYLASKRNGPSCPGNDLRSIFRSAAEIISTEEPVKLTPGKHDIAIEFKDAQGNVVGTQEILNLNIEAGGRYIMTIKTTY